MKDSPPSIFNIKIKPHLIHDYWLYIQAKGKLGLAKTKTKGEVRGGGKKPYRQKGTGHARQGSIRAPGFKGGGVIFGPTNLKNPSLRLNKKVRKSALIMSLATRYQENNVSIVENLKVEAPKTREFLKAIESFKGDGSILIILDKIKPEIALASRNISYVKVMQAANINLADILNFDKIVISKTALKQIEKIWGGDQK